VDHTVLAVGVVAAAAIARRRSLGSILGRVYYSLIAVAGDVDVPEAVDV
jgi:hypothetical protein